MYYTTRSAPDTPLDLSLAQMVLVLGDPFAVGNQFVKPLLQTGLPNSLRRPWEKRRRIAMPSVRLVVSAFTRPRTTQHRWAK